MRMIVEDKGGPLIPVLVDDIRNLLYCRISLLMLSTMFTLLSSKNGLFINKLTVIDSTSL